MEKRGQATVFIIIGIVIVIAVVSIVVLRGPRAPVEPAKRVTPTQVEPIRDFIRECIEKKVKEDADNLRTYNGFFDRSADPNGVVRIDGEEYNLAYYYFPYRGSLLFMPKFYLLNIKKGFERRIYEAVESCSIESNFSGSGYTFVRPQENEATVNLTFNTDSIIVNMEYPIKVSKGDVSTELEELEVTVEDSVGRFLEIEQALITHTFQNGELGDFEAVIAENNNADPNDDIHVSREIYDSYAIYDIYKAEDARDELLVAGKDE